MLFMLPQWLLFRRTDYLYYILYVFMFGIFIALRVNKVLQILPFMWSPLWNEITDQPLIVFAIWMLIRFDRHFLNLKQLQPKVYVYATWMEYGFAVYFFIKIAFNSIKIKPLHFITYLFSCNIHIGSLSHLCNCWFVEAKKLTQYFLYLAA